MTWMSTPNLAPVPLAVMVWAIVSLAAGTIGWAVCKAARIAPRGRAPSYLAAIGLGYVLLAYGILAIGLLGALRPWTIAVLVIAAIAIGIRHTRRFFEITFAGLGRALSAVRGSRFRLLYIFMGAWVLTTFLAALGPSDGRDWDGLSEHLAQAKTYLRHHRVEPLWWDHHSHFPATVVMLYCAGLALGGQGAAKLFHWGFGLLSLLAAWRLARRHLRLSSGGPAAWVLASTPMFGWLATVGYVDLAAVFYCLLAVDHALAWMESGRRTDLVRSAAMAGCGMAVKGQGLFTFGIMLVYLALWAWRARRRLRELVLFAVVAGAIAAPWYIKSWVVTGNPVYPFAYGIFGGKQWSAEQARHYAYHHASFGYGKLPPEDVWQRWPLWKKRLGGARHPLNMLIAPVTLTLFPEYYIPRQPRLTAMIMFSIGPMWLGLAPLLVLGGAKMKRRNAGRIAGLFGMFWAWWLVSVQLARYLLPWLAMVAALAGQALADRLESAKAAVARAYWTVAFVWSALAFWALWLHVGPVAMTTLGIVSAEEHLRASLDCYEAMEYLNTVVPVRGKVGTYGEPRTFYLDRDAIWVDPGHSQLIDYKSIHTAKALVETLKRLGIEYILVNQQFFGPLTKKGDELHRLLWEAVDEMMLVPVRDFAGGKILVLEVER